MQPGTAIAASLADTWAGVNQTAVHPRCTNGLAPKRNTADATERGWASEIGRHRCTAGRIRRLRDELGPAAPTKDQRRRVHMKERPA